MAITYEPIVSTTLTSTQTTVTFSSIPQTFTDLVLVMNLKTVNDGGYNYYNFNGDTATNYSSTRLDTDGTSAISGRSTNENILYQSHYANTDNLNFNTTIIMNLMNYSNTSTYKTTITKAINSTKGIDQVVGLWRSTAAISTILISQSQTMTAGCTFTLYGIKAA
jgi:hypothetical protein